MVNKHGVHIHDEGEDPVCVFRSCHKTSHSRSESAVPHYEVTPTWARCPISVVLISQQLRGGDVLTLFSAIPERSTVTAGNLQS